MVTKNPNLVLTSAENYIDEEGAPGSQNKLLIRAVYLSGAGGVGTRGWMAGLVAGMGAGARHRAGLHACCSRRVRGRAGDARTRVADPDTAVPACVGTGVQHMF